MIMHSTVVSLIGLQFEASVKNLYLEGGRKGVTTARHQSAGPFSDEKVGEYIGQ